MAGYELEGGDSARERKWWQNGFNSGFGRRDSSVGPTWAPYVSLLFIFPLHLFSSLLSSPRLATGEQLGALAAAWQPKSERRQECRAGGSQLAGGAEERGRRGDRGGELAGVGLDEEAATVEHGAAHAIALLQAVPELPERVHVSERRRARAALPQREVAVRPPRPSASSLRRGHPAGTERTRLQQQEKRKQTKKGREIGRRGEAAPRPTRGGKPACPRAPPSVAAGEEEGGSFRWVSP
uniref:DUF834 domain-containing protein n=1 Tax=Oryza meridionalis TaxID=40149 RepID=A0A0E0E5U1_9ORYZ